MCVHLMLADKFKIRTEANSATLSLYLSPFSLIPFR